MFTSPWHLLLFDRLGGDHNWAFPKSWTKAVMESPLGLTAATLILIEKKGGGVDGQWR